jgi:uncharacterized RDD family membrane protein YckC
MPVSPQEASVTTPTDPPPGAEPGSGAPQYGGPQYGAPQYGGPQYGAPPPGAPPYGYAAPPPGAAGGYGYGGPPGGYPPLANWLQRVGGALIDYVAPFIVGAIFVSMGHGLQLVGGLIYLVSIVWALYNAYLGGKTGQSYGKRAMGLRLLDERTGQTIGGGMGIARYFVHFLDGIVCDIGYLWPLWDSKRQTFADKLMHTVVVKV